MPYIDENARRKMALRMPPENPGELNYLVTKTIKQYLYCKAIGDEGTRNRYHHYNDVLGVLEAVKQELYRRKIASYENEKKAQNGDVY